MIKPDEFLAHLKAHGYAPSTLEKKIFYLGRFFSFLTGFGIDDPRSIAPSHIQRYQAYSSQANAKGTGRPLSGHSLQQEFRAVRQYLGFLANRKEIWFNPAEGLFHKVNRNRLPKDLLNEQEVVTILERPDTSTPEGLRDRAVLELLYSTAIRRRELMALNVWDVDLAQGHLRVNQGKGDKDRVVPLGAEACRWVEEYLKRGREQFFRYRQSGRPTKGRGEAALFINQDGLRLKNCGVDHVIRRYTRDFKREGRRVSCYTFRHSCATHMLRAGADIRVIQALLGHAWLLTTQIYTRVCPVELKQAHAKHHPRAKI